jgi:hypothetical protein
MKDFDTDRAPRSVEDRTFQIGGEVFVMRTAIRPEVLAAYEDLDIESAKSADTLKVIDELIVSCIEPADAGHDRYARLRTRDDDPITITDLVTLASYLVEGVTGRSPTQPSSPSISGPERTGTTLTADSSSPEPAAV